jgi:CheY-like chemotaxis protein
MTQECHVAEKGLVLVVEDEVLIRMAAVDIIEEAGFTTIEAGNADAAIRILEQRPDVRLVFTDIAMPGSMDGLKLAHYIRERWPPIRLMVASGHMILAEDQVPAGVRYFAKPYAGHVIAHAVQQLMAEVD